MTASLQSLAEIPIDMTIAALPKADLHLHQEAGPWMERLVARRDGRPPYDWQAWARAMLQATPPGMPRLEALTAGDGTALLGSQQAMQTLDALPEHFIGRLVDLLETEAAGGAILVEIRCGRGTILYPDFMQLFREAERRARERYPRLRAAAIICAYPHDGREEILAACIEAARDGLADMDLIPTPYDSEADWTPIARWAERAAAAGLGITMHAGEFSAANLGAALRTPGLNRIGHGIYAASEPRLLEELVKRGITLECCLSSNVVLGAVPSYEAHPLRRLVEAGVRVTLNTDNPLRLCTSIEREYAIAAALGYLPVALLGFTRNAIRASFLPPPTRADLLAEIDGPAMVP